MAKQTNIKASEPADIALVQFKQIATTIGLRSPEFEKFKSRGDCDEVKWCLPELACSAQLGLTREDVELMAKNQGDCAPKYSPPKVD